MMKDLYHIPIIILLCSSSSSPSLKWRRITPYVSWSLSSLNPNSSVIPLTRSGENPCHWRIEISQASSYAWNVLLVSLSLISRCFLLITCQELRPYWSNPVVVRCLAGRFVEPWCMYIKPNLRWHSYNHSRAHLQFFHSSPDTNPCTETHRPKTLVSNTEHGHIWRRHKQSPK